MFAWGSCCECVCHRGAAMPQLVLACVRARVCDADALGLGWLNAPRRMHPCVAVTGCGIALLNRSEDPPPPPPPQEKEELQHNHRHRHRCGHQCVDWIEPRGVCVLHVRLRWFCAIGRRHCPFVLLSLHVGVVFALPLSLTHTLSMPLLNRTCLMPGGRTCLLCIVAVHGRAWL